MSNRKLLSKNSKVLLSVDGTDCPIKEHNPFNTGYYSFKINHSALRYEVAAAVHTGYVVWVNGPYPAGWPDISIFRDGLKREIGPAEKVIADKGYKGESCIFLPQDGSCTQQVQMKSIRARQENINSRLKKFQCVKQITRHTQEKHSLMFHAVVVVVQIGFLINGPLYEVQFNF